MKKNVIIIKIDVECIGFGNILMLFITVRFVLDDLYNSPYTLNAFRDFDTLEIFNNLNILPVVLSRLLLSAPPSLTGSLNSIFINSLFTSPFIN